MAASSSDPRQTYDVFISFRGEDTRNGFTGHLYAALCRRKVNAYIDEDGLEKGNEISSALSKAIEESKISVVIFSENYASSSWCLSELAHILHCKEVKNQLVFPVFYHVEPSDVRQQRNSYAVAFAGHEKRFEDEKVQLWRNALKEAGNMCGWHISATSSEAKVVEEIVGDILKKLNIIMSSKDDFKDLVGIHKRAQEIERLLHFSSLDVRIIGIWGMSGIGKTTLAEVIFSRFAPQFESCCFLRNIKSKPHKLDKLQKKLFSELLQTQLEKVNEFVKDRLQHMKVLVVLDDVNGVEQLEYLAKDRSWFGHGSRIIITTRNKQVLNNIQADGVYELDELNSCEAHQLFYMKAFKGKSPSPVYVKMSRTVVTRYAKGVPLALKVLGCHLYSKSIEEWESELKRLEIIPHNEVHNVLKMSYNGLSSDEKGIFLDIAFFFVGKEYDFVKRILDRYRLGVAMGIRVLIDRSLITIDRFDMLSMHDLIQDMGIEIVRQQSPDEPGKRSRLWSTEDVCNVLKNNAGTEKIQGMSMELRKISATICLRPSVFKKMYNLKFLSFHGPCVEGRLHFPEGLKHLPDELRYLHWDDFPLQTLPENFWPQNLVELHLHNSKLRKLWDGVQHIESLKFLDLKECENLAEIPDLSWALNLEMIDLSSCKCLEHLPSSIGKLELLQVLKLFKCSKIAEFPKLPKRVQYLDMSYTAIKNVPQSIERLSRLQLFDLKRCKWLGSLPANLFKLESLKELYLEGCLGLEYLPEILDPMEHLTVFEIQKAGIRQLPWSIQNLVNITDLDLQNTSVSELPDWFFYLPALNSLDLSETNIVRIPESIKLSKLKSLWITDCKFLQSLPELPLSIELVDADGCTTLETVSNSWSLLSKGCKMDWDFWEWFSFDGCLKLDQKNIITEFQIRALFTASTLVLLRHKGWLKVNNKVTIAELQIVSYLRELRRYAPLPIKVQQGVDIFRHEIGILYPGDEIPEWFSHQTVGFSINMKLPPLWYSPNNFMGFAFCFVVENAHKSDNEKGDVIGLDLEIYLKTNYDSERHLRFVSWSIGHLKSRNTDHVLMVTYLDITAVDFDSVTEMSFHFSADYPSKLQIKRCGVRMLCLQEAFEIGIISDLHVFEKSNVVTNESRPSGFWKNVLYPLLGFQVFPSRQQICEKIWCSKIQQRHKDLWLQLVWDVLPVRQVLNRQMDVSDTSCPLCGTGLESATHLFLYCESVRPLWFMSPWGLRTDFLCCDSMASFLEVVLRGDPNSDVYHFDREFFRYASVLVHTIWLARNELIHNEKVFCVAGIHSSVHAQFNHSVQLQQYPKRLTVSNSL